MTGRLDLNDMDLQEMEGFLASLGEPKFRAKQIASWIFKKNAGDFSAMTDLAKPLRDRLEQSAWISSAEVITKQVSFDGTIKYLLRLTDGEAVETVLMRHSYGNSLCVSSQVGCRMGCGICASTLEGLIRNLSAGEMYNQVLAVQKDIKERISHIVLMGSGEPLDNLSNVLKFIRNITASYGLNIGYRHLTLSTCGIVPKIKELAAYRLQLTLAVSLHAADNELRSKLMPINRKYPLEELIPACRAYAEITGRRVTFEYALLAGVNDSPEQAKKLARLLRNMLCHVNIIPVNPVVERGYHRSDPETVKKFFHVIEQEGISSTVRQERGADIDAACGQLRRRALGKDKN